MEVPDLLVTVTGTVGGVVMAPGMVVPNEGPVLASTAPTSTQRTRSEQNNGSIDFIT